MPIRKLPGAAPTATAPLGAVQTIPPSHSPPAPPPSSQQPPGVLGGGHRLYWTSFHPGLSQILPGGSSLSEVLCCISDHWGQVLLDDRKTRRVFKMEIPPFCSHPPNRQLRPAHRSGSASARNSNLIYMLQLQQEPRAPPARLLSPASSALHLTPTLSRCKDLAPPKLTDEHKQAEWLG